MSIESHQENLRAEHMLGAPGVAVSGVIWIIAGLTAYSASFQLSVLVFFFGGMLIYPLSSFLAKTLQPAIEPQKDNPLNTLALEGTAFLFVGLFVGYILILNTLPDLFYPVMLLAIGARYLTFQTLYGARLYWGLGLILCALGLLSIQMFHLPPYAAALGGGGIELIFSAALFNANKK